MKLFVALAYMVVAICQLVALLGGLLITGAVFYLFFAIF